MTDGITVERAAWPADRDALHGVRCEVFVEEQGVPRDVELDDADDDAVHLIARDHRGTAVGCARLLPSGQIGRMAVLAQRRGFGIGRALLDAAVDAARERGDVTVFLHAQTHALDFYERAGFSPIGPRFEEAGIEHQRMEAPVGIRFEPAIDGPVPIVNVDADRSPYPLPSLADCPDAVEMLESEHAIAEAFERLAEHARREVLIYSQDLDPRYFDRPRLRDALSAFARRHGNTRLAILVHDTRRMVRDGHGLLELVRRLSSSMEIRIVHPDMRDREDSFMLVDRRGIVGLPRSSVPSGFLNLNDSPLTRQYANLFRRLHDRSVTDVNLRQMSI